jgi:hypothetical protein
MTATCPLVRIRLGLPTGLLLTLVPMTASADENAPPPPPGAVEVRFIDDSAMKLILNKDQRIELTTPYGKLLIPATDIRRIEFGLRISDETARKIGSAIAELGSQEFNRREAAGAELLALREKAYPALQQATRTSDLEVQRRAEDLLGRLRELVPAERLEMPLHDVVYTEHSKIAGQVGTTSLKVSTFQFGEQQLKLADVRSLRSLLMEPEQPVVNALPDPGTLNSLAGQVGKTFYFRVTGAGHGAGGVWGTDVYTTDSALAVAAVHAGLVRPGQTGIVKVTVLGPQVGFLATTRNGITSAGYGPYAGYRVSK